MATVAKRMTGLHYRSFILKCHMEQLFTTYVLLHTCTTSCLKNIVSCVTVCFISAAVSKMKALYQRLTSGSTSTSNNSLLSWLH